MIPCFIADGGFLLKSTAEIRRHTRLNSLEHRSDRRRRAGRKSSKRVHDGEASQFPLWILKNPREPSFSFEPPAARYMRIAALSNGGAPKTGVTAVSPAGEISIRRLPLKKRGKLVVTAK